MNELIKGAYDVHVHSGPDMLPRKVDDPELAERFVKAGLKGYVIKSHYNCTAERARVINMFNPDIEVYGSITLNNAIGGINPMAVEMAGRAGAKAVWFPTVDSENEQFHFAKNPYKAMPYWAVVQNQMKEDGFDVKTINILKDGKLIKEAYEVCEIIAKYDMILATSHLSKEETFALAKAAKEAKVKKLVITHVTFPATLYTIEEQKELLKYGAMMEHCYTTVSTGKVDKDVMMNQIREIGPSNIILATDLGQKANVYPDEGLSNFADLLQAEGFSDEDIKTMIVKNSNYLIK